MSEQLPTSKTPGQDHDGLASTSHRRLNQLTGEWVLVSAHRSKRPWQGQQEHIDQELKPHYDESCYLCPGNTRVSGLANPDYQDVYVFKNDHSALLPSEHAFDSVTDGETSLLVAKPEAGECRVVCFSPRHDLTLAHMAASDIKRVVDRWAVEYEDLGKRDDINYVQIFENKGAAMGCSNPHPHGQIWAQESIPNEPTKELERMRAHYESNNHSPLLMDYLAIELEQKERIVCQNQHFVALVPYWATWPFEILILPTKPISSLTQMNDDVRLGFAQIISEMTIRYDNLFSTSFPYSAGIHQAPTDGKDYPECTLHMHFYPPLLRSATVKKFMVGYEMLGGPQRDITAEKSAEMLRECSVQHYLVTG